MWHADVEIDVSRADEYKPIRRTKKVGHITIEDIVFDEMEYHLERQREFAME